MANGAIQASAHRTMDPILYRAAIEGNEGELQQLINELDIQHQLTQNNSTVLHVAAQFGQLEFVRRILAIPASLFFLGRQNEKGDTALHVAARQGHTDIVRELVNFANRVRPGAAMLWKTNKDKDMALHLAVKHGDLGMIQLLTGADPRYQYPANNAKKTPLYLACERGDDNIVAGVTPTYSVADGGRNVLHAAVVSGCTVQTINNLLAQQADLIREVDVYGWTPLHWAVLVNNLEKVTTLLQNDNSSTVAYTRANNDDEKIALHIAAAHGYVDIMENLLIHCPDSWEIVDGRGQNILHIAEEAKVAEAVINMIMARGYTWLNHLINQKDNDGNTPPDLSSGQHRLYENLRGNNVNLITSFSWEQICAEKSYITRRKEGLKRRAEELKEQRKRVAEAEENIRKRQKETREELIKTGESHLIVAALIATIAFTLAFTVPGNYYSSKSRTEPRVLLQEIVFNIFLISNSIAGISSIATVWHYITVPNLKYDQLDRRYINHLYMGVLFITKVSVAAILFAFATGAYIVLTHSRGLAVAIFVIGIFHVVLFSIADLFLTNY